MLRYHTATTEDGLPPGEGIFRPCSFWLAINYALQGRLDEAKHLFDRLLGIRNDVGLISEEYDPFGCALMGNFPQALTHISIVNTALSLTEALRRESGCTPD